MRMNRMTSKFLVRFGIFLVPLMLYFGVTTSILLFGGELMPLTQVAEAQLSNPDTLYRRFYRDDFRPFKLISTELHRPEVLALGSSRIMQFRSAEFVNGNSIFYNAGGSAGNVYEVRSFLEQLDPNALPKVAIINLDEDWFHPRYAQFARAQAPWSVDFSQEDIYQFLNLTRLTLNDVVMGTYPIAPIFGGTDPFYHDPAIGIGALTHSGGFRGDGSRSYGSVILDPKTNDERFAEMRARMQTEGSRFAYGDVVDEGALEEIAALMQFAQDNGIGLVLFSPPYPPSIYNEMMESGHYTYMTKTINRLAELARQHGVLYYNFMDGGTLGTDDDFFDGLHGSEYIYLHMLLEMLKDPNNPLIRYTNVDNLTAAFQRPRLNQFEVYGDVSQAAN